MQYLKNRKPSVETDKVRKGKRPHGLVGSELHHTVNIFSRRNALHQRERRFVDHRHEDQLTMNPA